MRGEDPGPKTVDGGAAPAPASPPPGQLGAFALLGAVTGTVPFPWIPGALARRLRGALVQDVAARHRVSLTRAAREVLADPDNARAKRGALYNSFSYIGRKVLVRFGPLAALPPLRAAFETYVLGYLFDRYLAKSRPLSRDAPPLDARSLDEDEARAVRTAIEGAVVRLASPDASLDWPTVKSSPEESRDELTQALDGLLSAATTIPSWFLRRLDVAFDDVLALP